MTYPNDPNQHGDDSNSTSGNKQPGGSHQEGSYHSSSFSDSGADSTYGSNYGSYPRSAADFGSEAKSSGKGFFGALLDVNFDNFIALKFAKFIYILAIVLAVLTVLMVWIFPTISLLAGEPVFGVVWLLLGWVPAALAALFQLIGIRLFLEFVVATIKTSENTSHLAANLPR